MGKILLQLGAIIIGVVGLSSVFALSHTDMTHAVEGDFSIQVTPSPLIATIKPGQQTDLELKVYNSGTSPVELKIEPRNFTISDQTGEVRVDDTSPAHIQDWIRFSAATFSVQPGQWFTQTVSLALPKDTGFSYHFALVLTQKNIPMATDSNRLLRGSVAVFTLINVDRPGATRKLEAVELEADKQIYEYLPAKISVKFKNTGNSIVQPYGNIFIQRGSDDSTPIATLPVNENKGYILPGAVRTLSTSWVSGFPRFVTDAEGNTKEEWDWSKIGDFRFGQYTVKLVGVYNDGQRDVPLETEVTFWVLPWKILLVLFVIISLVIVGVWSLIRKMINSITQRKHRIDRKHS